MKTEPFAVIEQEQQCSMLFERSHLNSLPMGVQADHCLILRPPSYCLQEIGSWMGAVNIRAA